MELVVNTVIVKSYFTRGSRIYIARQHLSMIELSAPKVNGFQWKAIAKKSSILDIINGSTYDYNTWQSNFNFKQTTAIWFECHRNLWKKLPTRQLWYNILLEKNLYSC